MGPKSKEVIEFGGTGPSQPVLNVEDIKEPSSPLYISKVPQKAKDVRVEPVVLFIAKVKVRVIGVDVSQVLHKSPPVKMASTKCKSLEEQEVSGGGIGVSIKSVSSGKFSVETVPDCCKIKVALSTSFIVLMAEVFFLLELF
jgi:hypothetical protein